MKKIMLLNVLLLSFIVKAQKETLSLYPADYFRNPLNIPILLAGNFGECRPNHFHSGIDIKTNGRENLPVFAAADGYVSRIKMEKGGFGHALYITHSNGFTTLYAHLNQFIPSLQRYTKHIQYEQESWAVDIKLKPEQFPVSKGQQIAWSGNTGASTAPHLHFEIRDTETEHPLNAMLFGLPITDTRSPVPTQVSLYDLNRSIYEQSPKMINVTRKGAAYSTDGDTIDVTTDKLGLGLKVNDFMNGSDNTLNIFTARWYMDGSLQGSIRLDDIGYDETRYLHAYVDYKTKKEKDNWYQLLFQLPGNMLSHLYPMLNTNRGALVLNDHKPHLVQIELHDANGNETSISFFVRATGNSLPADCNKLFAANKANGFELPNVRFSLGDHDIYDNLCFQFSRKADASSYSDKYQLHYAYVPVHEYFDLYLKPDKTVPVDLKNKIVFEYSDGRSEDGKAATFENGWYKAAVRNFGTYWLTVDTVAPSITSLQKEGANLAKAKQLRFSVKESMTSVKKFRAQLDGKWLCFEPRGDLFFYNFDEHCSPGRHRLLVEVADETGNTRTLSYNFIR